MNKENDASLTARLLAAYESDDGRSKMGRLRMQFETISNLQKGGMSLEKILSVLNEGKDEKQKLTRQTFNGYLNILRKERKNQMSSESFPITVNSVIPTKSKGKNNANSGNLDRGKLGRTEPGPAVETERPAGISNAAWSELQIKRTKANRTKTY